MSAVDKVSNNKTTDLQERKPKLEDVPKYMSAFDVDGDGKLDEFELQMMVMDKKHEGHVSNKQVYDLLKQQKELHHQVFNMKRLVICMTLFIAILALSNLATGWAAATLAKDTSVKNGILVDKTTGEAIATTMHVRQFTATSSGNPSNNERRLSHEVAAEANSISKGDARVLYDECGSGATIKRTVITEEHIVAICPADSSTKYGEGTDAVRYTYSKSGTSLIIICPAGDDSESCRMTGSALSRPTGAECLRDSDCADEGGYCFLNVCSVSDGNTYFYEQGSPDEGSGRSAQSPFNNLRNTIKLLQAGDTLKLVGEITNESYDPTYVFGSIEDDHLWNHENTLYIRQIHGEPGRPITITAKPGAVLKGDGDNIVRVIECSYFRFDGLEVYGEVERIPYSTAKALQVVYRDTDNIVKYRVDPTLTDEEVAQIEDMPLLPGIKRPSYTDTRGFYANGCHHIVVQNCHIHHTPGNGLRFAYSEYTDILDNEVDHCSLKSYAGTMGVTPTYIQDSIEGDPVGIYRLRVLRNKVHHNYNEIWSWNPAKTFITPHIDEGKGISCERCNTWKNGGRALFANNVVYYNGYSGLNSNDSSNLDFIGNTAYMNSYTDSVWTLQQTGSKGSASRAGITINDGTNHRMYNNIAVCDTDTGGICLGVFRNAEVEAGNNLQFGIGELDLRLDDTKPFSYMNVETNGLHDVDPLLKDPEKSNFRLTWKSPALGKADPVFAQIANLDFFREPRDLDAPDMGAIERE